MAVSSGTASARTSRESLGARSLADCVHVAGLAITALDMVEASESAVWTDRAARWCEAESTSREASVSDLVAAPWFSSTGENVTACGKKFE